MIHPVDKAHLKANNTKDMLIDKLENAERIIHENKMESSNTLAEYKVAHKEITTELRSDLAQANDRVKAYEDEVERLKADRVQRQLAVDMGLHSLSAYRIVLADVHANIKINPQVMKA